MKITIGMSVVIAVLLGGSFPARADDTATRQALKAASATIHSVVVELEMSPPGAALANMPKSIYMQMIMAAPDRAKMTLIAGSLRLETYQVDGIVYLHSQPGDSWRKVKYDAMHPPTQVLDLVRAAKNEQIAILPDSKEEGVTVGVVQISVQLPVPAGTASIGPPVTLTCNYDKGTYHFRSCANAMMSMTFTKYNDPSNTFELPAEAAGAVLIVPKTPLPFTTPSAAPTAAPSAAPVATPSATPTITPSATPMATPSAAPSASPPMPTRF